MRQVKSSYVKGISLFFITVLLSFSISHYSYQKMNEWQDRNTVTITLDKGRLGNQMFRYATALSYAKRFNLPFCQIHEKATIAEFPNLAPDCKGIHPSFICKESDIYQTTPDQRCNDFYGYFQNPKLFADNIEGVKQAFEFPPLDTKNQQLANKMSKENSISLHFRRGDYIQLKYPILGLEYYQEAIEYIIQRDNDTPHLYLFSDDTEWVEQHFESKYPFTIVKGNDALTDMNLMSKCRHNVIANSSYSWWGAYLNPNPKKIVIAPDTWDYKHPNLGKRILPQEWITLPAHAYVGGRVAIIYVATGRYIQFWDRYYEAMEKYFLPELPKVYYVFTDDTEKSLPENAIRIHQEQLPWPEPTLKRYHFINSIKKRLRPYQYIYFLNANMVPVRKIGPEILPTNEDGLVLTLHPGYYNNKNTKSLPYDRQKKSTAYVGPDEGQYYFAGGFNGGASKAFLKMTETIMKNTDTDTGNKIVARWHDESHLNRYAIDYTNQGNKPLILTPEYMVPEESLDSDKYSWLGEFKKEPKIILLDKKNMADTSGCAVLIKS